MSNLTTLGLVHTALSLIALVSGALVIGTVAATSTAFGGASRAIQTVSYSATLLFHLIPGFTEALTRLPPGAPVFTSAEAPGLKTIYGVLLLAFIVGVAFQLRRLRRNR